MSGTNSDFNILCGQVSAENLDILDKTCKEMKKLGFAFTMVDLLVSVQPPDLQPQERDVLFHDDDGVIVLKSEKQRSEIIRVIKDNGLSIAACHFLQTLQPIGEKPGWIFEIHERLLDAAASAGAGTITTHFAWMFGEGNVALMGDFIARLNRGQISRDEFMEEKQERCGGREKVWQDSLEIYAHLCSKAASRSIAVTIETVPGPFEMHDPNNINEFIAELRADNLGICVDTGHCNAVGFSSAEAIRRASDKMMETHFHDNFGPQNNWALSDTHNPVGVGTINWVEVIRALEETGYTGCITFEQRDFRANLRNWRHFLQAADKLK